MEKIKVIVTDDHGLFRKGVISLIEEDKKIEVIAEASNGKELMEILKKTPTDVVLLDLDMPLMDGDESYKKISSRYPAVKVIILSGFLDDELVSHYLGLGVKACLDKNCANESLIKAIHAAYKNQNYLYQAGYNALLSKAMSETGFEAKKSLTEREIEILKEICSGKTNKQISEALAIAMSTVDFHRGNIYLKTKANNPAELALYAVKNGIVKP